MFLAATLVMTIIAAVAALWPLAVPETQETKAEGDAAFFTAQLAEIERDVERGLMPAGEAGVARAETARRLLAAREATPRQIAAARSPFRRLLASGVGLAVILGVGAFVYSSLGSPAAADQPLADRKETPPQDNPHQDDPVFKAVTHIEEEVAASPDNVKAWSALAPVYLRLGRYADSAMAYRKLLELSGEDANLRANLGEAETAAAEGKVTPEAKANFEKALTLDPNITMAKYYLALASEQAGETKKALEAYEALVGKVADRPHWVSIIRNRIATLKGEKPVEVKSTPGESARSDDAVQGMVGRLATRLAEKGGTAEEWLRLIRSYGVMEQKDKAEAALVAAHKAHDGDTKAKADLDAIAQEFGLGGAPAPVRAQPAPAPETPPAAANAAPPEDMIQGMVSRLATRLDQKGGTAEEWVRLIRSYGVLQQADKAKAALATARKAHGGDPKAKADLDAIALEFKLDAP